MLGREGVAAGVAGFMRGLLVGDGVTGRRPGSARRINWKGVRLGEPLPGDEDVLTDFSLVPFGVDNCSDGSKPCAFESGVVGLFAVMDGLAMASRTVAAFIQRSSFRGGEGGNSASKSAKCPFKNL